MLSLCMWKEEEKLWHSSYTLNRNILAGKEILSDLNVIPVSVLMYFPRLVFQYQAYISYLLLPNTL